MAKTAKMRSKQAKARRSVPGAAPRWMESLLIEAAGRLPLHEVLVTRDRDDEAALVQILVARQAPGGRIVAGAFAVDMACLGVKSAFAGVAAGVPEYRRRIREPMSETQPLVPAGIDLAAKIIREGLSYARSLGFEPDPGYEVAKHLLDGADPDSCTVPVPVGGRDGKPFYVAGPYDDAPAVVQALGRRLGPDGFHFIAPL